MYIYIYIYIYVYINIYIYIYIYILTNCIINSQIIKYYMLKECCNHLFYNNNKHGGVECSPMSKEIITPIFYPTIPLSIRKMSA